MQPEYTERLLNPKMEYYRYCYKDSPLWDGEEELAGKTIIVYGEQGLGDIIQFARYIPLLKSKGCDIIFHCPSTLHKLFLENLQGVSSCINAEVVDLPRHDYHIPSMSLPFALGSHEADVPYLCCSDSSEINEEFENNFKIGIAWEGNPNHSNNDQRSCPLSIIRKVYNLDRVKLFMLQQEVHNPKYVEGCDDIEILGIELPNMQITAELIQSMNLIISVDTSVMHLACALGKKTFCLLSEDHDPRWDLDINWYPSMRKIVQKTHADWLGLSSELTMHTSMEHQKWLIKNP